MKYIQDENTESLLWFLTILFIIDALIIFWLIKDRKKMRKNETYHGIPSKWRLYGILIMSLIGIYAALEELFKRI